jgi:hypothetical protein
VKRTNDAWRNKALDYDLVKRRNVIPYVIAEEKRSADTKITFKSGSKESE